MEKGDLESSTIKEHGKYKEDTILRILTIVLAASLLAILVFGMTPFAGVFEFKTKSKYDYSIENYDFEEFEDKYLNDGSICGMLTSDGIMQHVKDLVQIGLNNPTKSRAVGIGYDASAEYVEEQLRGNQVCEPKRQYFVVPVWRLKKPALLSSDNGTINYQYGVDFRIMRYGGKAVELTNVPIQLINECGTSFEPNKIALTTLNPDCSVFDLAYKAQNAGSLGIIFVNPQSQSTLSNARARILEWKEGDPLITIPVINVLHSVGKQLELFASSVSLTSFAELELKNTFNVLCEIRGSKSDAIVIGSHLDSVEEGPGANDNGSGSSFTLALSKLVKNPINTVIFAWFGAEELGLLGSYHYVKSLPSNHSIKFNLNFDMLGSPNHVAYVHDGKTAPQTVTNRSMILTKEFEHFFNSHSLNFTLGPMFGGSDFLPFLKSNIPSGGLLTGAGGIKTMDERIKYQGLANAAYDPCYHQSCDTFENVDPKTILKMSKAGCFVISEFMNHPDLDQIFGKE